AESIRAQGFDLSKPIAALYVDHVFYIADGHARTAAAVRAGTQFVSCAISASNNERYRGELSARQYVQNAVSDSLISEWERAAGFRYEAEIWKGRAAATVLTGPGS